MINEIVCFALLFGCAFARPDGAPLGACENMIPQHPGQTPTNLTYSPYQVSANTSANGEISVFVSVTPGKTFRGILLQARTAPNGMPMGTWNLPAGGEFKLSDCLSQTSSALTHTSRTDKTDKMFSWNPPYASYAKNFTFYATVVTNISTFYVMIPSNQITVPPKAMSPSTVKVQETTTTSSSNRNAPSLCFWIVLVVGSLLGRTYLY